MYSLSLHRLAFHSNWGIFWSNLLAIRTCKLPDQKNIVPHRKVQTGKLTNQSLRTTSAYNKQYYASFYEITFMHVRPFVHMYVVIYECMYVCVVYTSY